MLFDRWRRREGGREGGGVSNVEDFMTINK
jgi:hypothetical protein